MRKGDVCRGSGGRDRFKEGRKDGEDEWRWRVRVKVKAKASLNVSGRTLSHY